jgi:hypothetical protein
MGGRRGLLLLLGLLLVVPLAGAGGPADWAAFQELPAAKRQQLVRFVGEWRELEPATRDRLRKVLLRYTDWLDRLTPEERRSVLEAPDRKTRLKRIRDLREKQWLATLPAPDRAAVPAEEGPERRQRIQDLRRRAQQRDLAWHLALLRSDDQHEFNAQVTLWTRDLLAPPPRGLRPDDRRRLKEIRDDKDKPPLADLQFLRRVSPSYGLPVPPLVERRLAGLDDYPAVPAPRLVEFLNHWVEKEEEAVRKDFENRLLGDAEQREQALAELTRLYWRYHPEELQKVRAQEEERNRNLRRVMGK